jgi:hypothetical protein
MDAVTEINNMASMFDKMWSTSSSTKPVKNTEQRSKNKSEIKRKCYQDIFQLCIDSSQSDVWKRFYEDCKCGNLPPGFTLRNNILYYRKNGGKKFERPLNATNGMEPEDKYKYVHEFFTTYAKLNENSEEALERFEAFLEDKSKPITWSIFKKKRQSAIAAINSFCNVAKLTMKKEGITMSDHALKMLFNTLDIGLISGVITDDDVEIYDGQLVNVRCIYWDSELMRFSLIEPYQSYYNHYLLTGEPVKKKSAKSIRKKTSRSTVDELANED